MDKRNKRKYNVRVKNQLWVWLPYYLLGTMWLAPSMGWARDKAIILPIESITHVDLVQEVQEHLTKTASQTLQMPTEVSAKLGLDEAKLTFECGDESAECMATVGKTINTRILLWGTLTGRNKLNLRLRGVNVSSKRLEYSLDVSFSDKTMFRNSLPAIMKAFIQRRPFAAQANLRVTTVPSGASIVVDGEARGLSPVDLTLEYGRHRLEITVQGYETQRQTIEIEENTETRNFRLMPRASPVLDGEYTSTKDNPRWPLWLGVSMGAAGLTATALGLYYGLENQSIDKELKQRPITDNAQITELRMRRDAASSQADKDKYSQDISAIYTEYEPYKKRRQEDFSNTKMKANILYSLGGVALCVSAYGFFKYFGESTQVSIGPNQVSLEGSF